ncbi:MAG: hypothetical protein NC078_08080 [Ruminococcus sp.]|nr:hypothetical protein [Ruminococcus sp.]
MEKIFVELTVRQKAPASTAALLAAALGLSLTVYLQRIRIKQLEKELCYGTVY